MPQDEDKMFTFYMNDAKQEDSECLYEVREWVRYEICEEENVSKPLEYYTKAGNIGHAGAVRMEGYSFENGIGLEPDFARRNNYYKAAAEAGDVLALAYIGFNILHGQLTRRGRLVGVGLVKLASGVGCTDALLYLDDCHCYGWGVEQDLEEAVRLFLEASKEKNLFGLTKVGWCYMFGSGVVQN